MPHTSLSIGQPYKDEEFSLGSAKTAPSSLDQKRIEGSVIILTSGGLHLSSLVSSVDGIYVTDSGTAVIIEAKMPARRSNVGIVITEAVTQDPETIKLLLPNYTFSNTITTSEEPSLALDECIKKLMAIARESLYESDLLERFSSGLESLLVRFGDAAVISLAPYVLRGTSEIAAEILRCFGNIADQRTYKSRLWVVMKALQSSSSWIRDSATLALAIMQDTLAIPYLETAIANERNEELKRNMLPVLEHLRSIQ